MAFIDFRSMFLGPTAVALGQAIGAERPPACRLRNGRVTVELRSVGGTAWPAVQRLAHARKVADAARAIFARDHRWWMRVRAARAIVVIYEDEYAAEGCTVTSRCSYVLAVNQPPPLP